MSDLKEAYEFNCQQLSRVSSELVDLKCENERLNEENKKLKICNLEKSKLIVSLNKRKNFYVKALNELMGIISEED